jgi:predicted nucleic acid-binding protein
MNAVDTNVFVYALSADEPAKKARALDLLRRLSIDDTVLLWQVAAELGAVLTRMARRGRATQEALDGLHTIWTRFHLVLPNASVLTLGLQLHRTRQISYWDAMLIAACVQAGVDRLYTEDLQSQPDVEGVSVVNPFIQQSEQA